VKTEEFPESPLQVIPPYRLSHFLADNDPQTRPALSVGTQEHQEIPGAKPFPPSRGSKVFPSKEESVLFGKGLIRALASLCFQRVAHRVIRAYWGQASSRRPIPKAFCGPWPSDGSRPFFHLASSYEPEIRVFFFFESCWADRYVSWLLLATFRLSAIVPSHRFAALDLSTPARPQKTFQERAPSERQARFRKGHFVTLFYINTRGTQIGSFVNFYPVTARLASPSGRNDGFPRGSP
jgi:hypothetical protein